MDMEREEGSSNGSDTTSEESFDTVYDRHFLECYGRPYGGYRNGKEGVAGFDRAKSVEDVGAGVLFEDVAAEVLDVENDNCNNIHVGQL